MKAMDDEGMDEQVEVERVSHLGSLERMTRHQEKDERMGGEMVVVCGKEGGKKKETWDKETENRRRRHFFWVMQSLKKTMRTNSGVGSVTEGL